MRSRSLERRSIVHSTGSGLALVMLWVWAGGTAAPAARGETLRWKFKPGETLRYVMEQKSVSTAKIPGAPDVKTTMSQTIEMTWAVKNVDPSGLAELTQTITRIRDQVEAPQIGSYTYDSKEAKEPEGLVAAARIPVFKAILGVAVPFKMSPLGEPGDVRVPESLVKTLGELGPAAAGAAAAFSEEGLKEMIARASLVLPRDDLSQGKTWTRQTRSASPVGTFILDQTFRYDGPAADIGPDAVKISLEVKADIQGAEADDKDKGLKIRGQKSQGSFVFDKAAGHIVESTLIESIEVAASVKVGLGALAREMEVVQMNETSTVRRLVK